ncbi:MAG: hypothetical protein ABI947_12745 [Chloroflexota bacterium]
MIFVILAIVLSIIGLALLIVGKIPVSRTRTIEGTQARAVGCVLLLAWPALFMAGIGTGLVWVLSNGTALASSMSQATLAELLLPYADLIRASAIAAVLLLALAIAYWSTGSAFAPSSSIINRDFLWFPIGTAGLLFLMVVLICQFTVDLGKPCKTFACARLESAKTSVVLNQTLHVIHTVAAINSTTLAPTRNMQNTRDAMTNTAFAPTHNALNLSAAMTNTVMWGTMNAYNKTQAFLRATPSPTRSAFDIATDLHNTNRLATITSAAQMVRQPLPGKLFFMTKKGVRVGVFEPGGDQLRLFTIDNFSLSQVVASPIGKQLAITGRPRDGSSSLFLTDTDGKNLHGITDVPYQLADPAWSADGQFIAAVGHLTSAWTKGVFEPQRNDASVLEIFSVDTFHETHIYNTNDFIKTPSWSPDGKTLAFCLLHPTSYSVYTTDLYTIAIDGSALHQLTTNGRSCAPAWSPDGQYIAFLINADSWHPYLYLMKPDGTEVRQLTECLGGIPHWSPDSKHVVFIAGVTQSCADSVPGDQGVFMYDLDTDGLHNITPTGFRELTDNKTFSVTSLSWIP